MKFSVNPYYAAPALALALSLPLMNTKNLVAVFAGGMSAAGSIGFLGSMIMTADDRKKANSAITKAKKELDTREQSLAQRFKNASADLQQKLRQAIADRDQTATAAKAQIDAIHSQRRHLLNEAKAAMGDEMRRKFEAEYQARFEQKTADFNRREDQFYHAEGELCDQIEVLQTAADKYETYLKEEFYAATKATTDKFAANYQGVLSEIENYDKVIQMTRTEALAELQQKELIISRLKGQVDLLAAPKKYRGNSQDDATANKVLEFFLSRGIGVEAEDWQRSFHQLKVLLFPKGGKLSDLVGLADDLQIALGLYSKPAIEIEGSLFSITCDTDAKVAVKATINEPPLSRLEQAISEAIHVRIAAPSGSGKSVLLGNLTNYLTQTYLSSYQLYDPKVTDRKVWGNLTPTYYSTDCLPALFSLADECLKRINLSKKAAENDTAAPKFNPEFHIIDELEFMYGLVDIVDSKDYTAKKFAINVKTGLKVGREHKIKLLFVTQSALCSDVNLKKNDFFNTTSLFLGQTIIEALESDLMYSVSAERKAVLKAEYKARLARGDKYTILVYEPEKPTEAWLCAAPSPGHYAAISDAVPSVPYQNENPVLGGVAPRTLSEGTIGAAQSPQGFEQGTEQGTAISAVPCSVSSSVPSSAAIESLLNQGTHCPACGHHSTSYAKPTPNSKGNVSVKCKNSECSRKTFSWKVA